MNKLSRKAAAMMLVTIMLAGSMAFRGNEISQAYAADTGIDAGLVAHYKFDGDLKDSSSNGNNGTEIGNITFEDSVLGKGAKFDGKSYIEVKDSDSLDLEKNFTFSFWVKKEEQTPRGEFIPYLTKINEQDEIYPYAVREWFFGDPEVGLFDLEDTANLYCIPSGTFLDWGRYELITMTGDGSSVKIYIDNKLVKSAPKPYGFVKSSQPLWIGSFNHLDKSYFFKGVLDDLRIYNRTLSYNEVQTLYNSGTSGNHGYFVNRPKNLVAFYRFENNFTDSTFFKNDGSAVESKGGMKFVDGIAGKAARFNGASYIEVPDNPWLNPEKEFTFSAWVKPESDDDIQPLLRKYDATTEQEKGVTAYDLGVDSQAITTVISMHDDKEIKSDISETAEINLAANSWYYVTVAYKNGGIKTYLNGKLIKANTLEDGVLSYSSGKLIIGSFLNNVFYKGLMDELRLYNYALGDKEIKSLYNSRDSLAVSAANNTVFSNLKVNQNVQLKVSNKIFSFAAQKDMLSQPKEYFNETVVTSNAKYISSNPKIATVSSTGKVTPLKKGKVSITVIYNNLKHIIAINIK